MTHMTESELHDRASRLVADEVLICLSALVHTLAKGCGAALPDRDLSGLAEQAFELSCPVPDYESAAWDAGWRGPEPDEYGAPTYTDQTDGQTWTAASWQEVCEAHDIEPYARDVYEHWAVSGWLADKLEERGERVDRDFANLNVWARTTTGQAISMDGVIHDTIRELHRPTADARPQS